jgi:hypothetical protein
MGPPLLRRNRKPSQLDREAGLVMKQGAKGRKLEKGRDIASGAPSFNRRSQATGGLRTVGAREQAFRAMAIQERGIPFGSRRIWAAYPALLKLDPRGFSQNAFNRVSESSSLASTGQSRESYSHIGYEALCPGDSLVQESFFLCSVMGLGSIAGLGNL